MYLFDSCGADISNPMSTVVELGHRARTACSKPDGLQLLL